MAWKGFFFPEGSEVDAIISCFYCSLKGVIHFHLNCFESIGEIISKQIYENLRFAMALWNQSCSLSTNLGEK